MCYWCNKVVTKDHFSANCPEIKNEKNSWWKDSEKPKINPAKIVRRLKNRQVKAKYSKVDSDDEYEYFTTFDDFAGQAEVSDQDEDE